MERPSRSDLHLSREEEERIEKQTREIFDEIAPKRHSKPQRSEYSSVYVDSQSEADNNIPELSVFQQLQNVDTQKLRYSGSQVNEEFVETDYYKDLNCIDKQHHQTGTGFIKIEDRNSKAFSLAPDSSTDHHIPTHGNPATNDWIPVVDDTVTFTSNKPCRSDE